VAIQAVLNQQIVLADFDTSCRVTSYGGNVDVNTLDATTVCSTGWAEYVPGLLTWQLTADGFVDFAAANVDAKLGKDGLLGATVTPVTVCPTANGGADGELCFFGKGLETNYQILSGAPGELAPFNLTTVGAARPLVRGNVLAPSSAAQTATGNGTGRQLGAVSATQAIYFGLHVLAISGSPTFSVVLESAAASNFSGATTRITSANYSTATGSEFQQLSGAITDTWWRARWTVTGGTNPSITFLAVAGIAVA